MEDGRARGAHRAVEHTPPDLITHRFELKDADKAYALMASGKCGKVAVVFK